MDGIRELILAAGWPGMVTLALGVLAFGVGLTGVLLLVKQRPAHTIRTVGMWALVLAVATFAMGGIGYWLGMRHVEAAVLGAAPDQRELLMQYGRAEAFGCVKIALYVGTLPFLMGLIAFLGARSRANPPGGDYQPPTTA